MDIGDKVSSFRLNDHLKNEITEQTFLNKWTVLYFYPKDSTPGCTKESCSFRDYRGQFTEKNTQIFGVSKDSEKSHMNFAIKQNLNFPLIVDTDGILLEMFGVWQLKKLYGKKYMGIVRSTFIINADGIIVKKYDNVKVKEHVETVLEDLKLLQTQ